MLAGIHSMQASTEAVRETKGVHQQRQRYMPPGVTSSTRRKVIACLQCEG